MERGHLAYSVALREAWFAHRPEAVAVELPAALSEPVRDLALKLPRIHLLGWRDAVGRGCCIVGDPADATMEALRLGWEHNIPVEPVDDLDGADGAIPPILPDPEAMLRIGLAAYATLAFEALGESALPMERARRILARIAILRERHESLLLVLEFPVALAVQRLLATPQPPLRLPAETMPAEIRTIPLRDRLLGILLWEIPRMLELYERHRRSRGRRKKPFDSARALTLLLRLARDRFEEDYDTIPTIADWRTLLQYVRNLSLRHGRLIPGLEDLIVAAKGCVNDDYAAMLLEYAVGYRWNAASRRRPPDLGEVASDSEESPPVPGGSAWRDVHLGRQSMNIYLRLGDETARLEPIYPTGETSEVTFRFKRRPTAEDMMVHLERWRRADLTQPSGICSWPPEDLALERFMTRIRHRALEELADRQMHIEEFTTSLQDGVAVRDTIRQWHRGKLLVQRRQRPRGKVGPVVIIWERTHFLSPDLWAVTLYAEHHNESDIAIVTSPLPEKQFVGPAVMRTEYKSMLSVFPPRQIPDIFSMPEFLVQWGEHGRALIAAAIVLSEERYVAVVSATGPDEELRQLAQKHGVLLIHLPLSVFSSTALARIRRLHILATHAARDWAEFYIPKT